MDDNDDAWQRRIRDLYANVEELYSHIDVTVVVFDRNLAKVSRGERGLADEIEPQLAAIARRVLDSAQSEDIALDHIGRVRVHAFPLTDGESVVGVTCVLVDDGARRELFVRSAMAIFDGYRQNEAALLARERKALDEAQRANRQRDQFLAVVAHELQAPMTSILLWERVLREPALDAATQTSALEAIHESATGGSLLVADLLDVSRAMNRKLRIDRSLVPLTRLLQLAIEDARRRVASAHVAIVADLDPQLGQVYGDSRRLRQVFNNLLSNALKCTDEGQVSVLATQDDHAITVEIRDTGRGIAPAFLPHVFEAFKQADERYAGAGLGLGLAIAYELVDLHGGTLSAASEGLGHGARFTVTLPRAPERAAHQASLGSSIAHVRVLVVDDDALLLEGLLAVLRSVGASVTGAKSASAAYAVLEAGGIDILVSDIGMPGEDGCSFVQRLRAMQTSTSTIPAIAITAMDSDATRDHAEACGFNRYITKPIDVPALIASISELVPLPS